MNRTTNRSLRRLVPVAVAAAVAVGVITGGPATATVGVCSSSADCISAVIPQRGVEKLRIDVGTFVPTTMLARLYEVPTSGPKVLVRLLSDLTRRQGRMFEVASLKQGTKYEWAISARDASGSVRTEYLSATTRTRRIVVVSTKLQVVNDGDLVGAGEIVVRSRLGANAPWTGQIGRGSFSTGYTRSKNVAHVQVKAPISTPFTVHIDDVDLKGLEANERTVNITVPDSYSPAFGGGSGTLGTNTKYTGPHVKLWYDWDFEVR